jgi:hypothetical protein
MFNCHKIPIWSSFPLSSPLPFSTQIISIKKKIYLLILRESSSIFFVDFEEKKLNEILNLEDKICAVITDNVEMIYFICIDNGMFSEYRYFVYKMNISQNEKYKKYLRFIRSREYRKNEYYRDRSKREDVFKLLLLRRKSLYFWLTL